MSLRQLWNESTPLLTLVVAGEAHRTAFTLRALSNCLVRLGRMDQVKVVAVLDENGDPLPTWGEDLPPGWVEAFQRVTVDHQSLAGHPLRELFPLAAAWEAGMEAATGAFVALLEGGSYLPEEDLEKLFALLEGRRPAAFSPVESWMVLSRRWLPHEFLACGASPAEVEAFLACQRGSTLGERLHPGLAFLAGGMIFSKAIYEHIRATEGEATLARAALRVPWFDLSGLGIQGWVLESAPSLPAERLPASMVRDSTTWRQQRLMGLTLSQIEVELSAQRLREEVLVAFQGAAQHRKSLSEMFEPVIAFYQRVLDQEMPRYWDWLTAVRWYSAGFFPLSCLVWSERCAEPLTQVASACRPVKLVVVQDWKAAGRRGSLLTPAHLAGVLDACGHQGHTRFIDAPPQEGISECFKTELPVDLAIFQPETNDLASIVAMLSAMVPPLAPGGVLVFHHSRPEIFAAVWERLSEHWPALPGLVCGSSGLLLNATLAGGETGLPDPAFTEVKRLLSGASACLGRGALDEAEALLEQVLIWAPGMSEAVKALGHIYLQTGRYEKAVQNFYAALMENPGDLEVLLMMAGMFLQAGDPEQAQGYAERALALAPDNPVALQMVQMLGTVAPPAN
ncbi:MAG TPA: hypothetical protein DEQ80_00430 [Anaerolinea thermolimosa]|uniref:Uncharacterized protein n=1 Tax=Anaerolinea thermolimosa TaxID=229919 RepID=A0A3D1JCI6_9CHLR|nr:hypothetical protein [Anaerolinea thermolimosa]